MKIRGVVLAVFLVVVCPGVAQAALVGDWGMPDVGSPPPQMTDTSGLGNDGSVSGGVIGHGKVFTFDGTGVGIVPDTPELNPGTKNAIITASISFTQSPPNHDYDIVRKKPNGVKGMQYRMEINKDDKAKCFFTGSTGDAAITAEPVLSDGRQHKIVCTKTQDSIKVTVDGQTKTKDIVIGAIMNSEAISIGAKGGGGNDFIGSINFVRINHTASPQP
jgi:hypothetical protein